MRPLLLLCPLLASASVSFLSRAGVEAFGADYDRRTLTTNPVPRQAKQVLMLLCCG